MKIPFICTLLLLFAVPFAYAHTTVDIDSYQIEVGWDIEPPIVNFRNSIVIEVRQVQSAGVSEPILNAFSNLEATAGFGGVSKVLDVNIDATPGHYYSPIIPTRVGSYTVSITGMIDSTPVNVDIRIEDIKTTDSLDFPLRQPSDELNVLQGTVNLLAQDIQELQSSDTINNETTYDLAILGASMGIIGLIVGVIAIIKKR